MFPVVEQDPVVLATALLFWGTGIEKAADTGVGVGTGFLSVLSDKGQICSFKLHTGPDSNIYTELLSPSSLFPGLLHWRSITAHRRRTI